MDSPEGSFADGALKQHKSKEGRAAEGGGRRRDPAALASMWTLSSGTNATALPSGRSVNGTRVLDIAGSSLRSREEREFWGRAGQPGHIERC